MAYVDENAPLSGLARLMSLKGREGDTMLAHINPMEAKMLQAMGGSGSLNPHTGLPEFYSVNDTDDDDARADAEAAAEAASDPGQDDTLGESDEARATAADFGPSSGFGGGWSDAIEQANEANKALAEQGVFSPAGPLALLGNKTLDRYSNMGKMGKLGSFFDENPIAELMVKGIATAINPLSGMLVGGGLAALQRKDALGMGLGAASGVGHGAGLIGSAAYELTEDPKNQTQHSFSNVGPNVESKVQGAVDTVRDIGNTAYDTVTDPIGTGKKGLASLGNTLTNTSKSIGSFYTDLDTDLKGYQTKLGEQLGQPYDPSYSPSVGEGSNREELMQRPMTRPSIAQPAQSPQEEATNYRRVLNPMYPTTQEGLLQAALKGITVPRYILQPQQQINVATGGHIEKLSQGSYGMVKDDGTGDGMSDNVEFDVNGDPEVDKAMLSPDEYVIDAHTVAALGNGSSSAGAKVLDKAVAGIRSEAYNKGKQPKQMNGLATLAKHIKV